MLRRKWLAAETESKQPFAMSRPLLPFSLTTNWWRRCVLRHSMPAGLGPKTTDATTPGYTEIHRSSRRLLGLPPQCGPLVSSARKMFSTTATPIEHADPSAAVSCVVNTPHTPNSFHGNPGDDVQDWLDHIERVVAINDCDNHRELKNVYISLLDAARVG